MTGIVDYGMGNLGSVKRKLDRIGEPSQVISNPVEFTKCSRLILPGVGNFQQAVYELKRRQLWEVLNEEVQGKKKQILGICLGMQLMSSFSEEGNASGFGWFDAKVVRFRIKDTTRFKIPHIGWNQVVIEKDSALFDKINMDTGFYFVHSYHIVCYNPADILNTTEYEYSFVSAIQKDNITGVQYHPEKSHDAGERLLRNFINL